MEFRTAGECFSEMEEGAMRMVEFHVISHLSLADHTQAAGKQTIFQRVCFPAAVRISITIIQILVE